MSNSSKYWSGRRVTQARALIEARGWPQPCCRCGHAISPHDRWQVDHYPVGRSQALKLGIPLESLQVLPAHARCNEAAGGRLGAAITNRKTERKGKAAPRRRSRGANQSRNIRGV